MSTELPLPWVPFEQLPEDLRREVTGRATRLVAIVVGSILGLVSLIGILLGGVIGMSTVAGAVGILYLGSVLLFALPIGLGVFLQLFGGQIWPALLRNDRLIAGYSLSATDLSPAALRGGMKQKAYWWHGFAGFAAFLGLVSLTQTLWILAAGKFFGPPVAIVWTGLVGYGLAVRAWHVRTLVGQRAA